MTLGELRALVAGLDVPDDTPVVVCDGYGADWVTGLVVSQDVSVLRADGVTELVRVAVVVDVT